MTTKFKCVSTIDTNTFEIGKVYKSTGKKDGNHTIETKGFRNWFINGRAANGNHTIEGCWTIAEFEMIETKLPAFAKVIIAAAVGGAIALAAHFGLTTDAALLGAVINGGTNSPELMELTKNVIVGL